MSEKLKVAIIGGGISGMSAAYHLKEAGHTFKIFEFVHNLGGNARTIPLDIGGFNRWVDLGVNDFNKNSYVNLVKMFDKLGVAYAPLEDSTCYANMGSVERMNEDRRIGFTMDGRFGHDAPEGVQRGAEMFGPAIKRFLQDMDQHPEMMHWTMDQFVKWAKFPEEFIYLNLYPRINGMYFTSTLKPSSVSARQVAHYYFLQEGYGMKLPPERMYWVGGTVKWIRKLTAYLQHDLPDAIYRGVKAQFEVLDSGKIRVYTTPVGSQEDATPKIEDFDRIILGVQTRHLESVYYRSEQVPEIVKQVKKSIGFEEDNVVPHTATNNMPEDPNLWRTYNINIFPDRDSPEPYNITYWCNRHQNDLANPEYAGKDVPQYFLTLNPVNPIPEACKLAQPAFSDCTMFKFYHCRLDQAATKAQDHLVPHMMKGLHDRTVYFTGGYTKGAGLHEECWLSGQTVVNHMLDATHEDMHSYMPPLMTAELGAAMRHPAPKYMLDLL